MVLYENTGTRNTGTDFFFSSQADSPSCTDIYIRDGALAATATDQ
jgi:hypothetical protein